MTDPTAGRASLFGVAEDERAVAVEGEGRRLGRGPGRDHEPAALVVAEDHVGRAGLVLEGADGGGARARRDARRARWRRRRPTVGRCWRPNSSTRRGPGRGRPEPRGATSSTWRRDVHVARMVPRDASGCENSSKGLDGTRIFTAMSSGLRARADRARTPISCTPPPTRCPLGVGFSCVIGRPSGGGSGEGVPRP